MNKELIAFILNNNIDANIVKSIQTLAKKAPFSTFENRPIEDIKNDIIDWVYEQMLID